MQIIENIRMAFRSLRGNILRASLTILIIAFGIMALVGILTAIDSIIYSMSDSFSSLGANSFSIRPADPEIKSRQRGRVKKRAEAISFEQAVRFKNEFSHPGKVSLSFPAKSRVAAKYMENETNPVLNITGVDENYMELFNLKLDAGRYFSSTELRFGNSVVIIGSSIVNKLFDGKSEKANGESISIDGNRFRVIGSLESEGASMNQSADSKIFIPLVLAKQLYGGSKTNYQITVGVNSPELFAEATSAAVGQMRVIRGLRPDQGNDFEIRKSDHLIERIKENTVNIRLGTIVIGIMTILGAAIGLMNIMLVSVTERTREIGIIKSIGATKNHILTQFLTEAVVICLLGGILGIILGILMGNIVTILIGGSFIVPWQWMGMAMGICVVVGLIAGLYPAVKAAGLDPIESLRYE